MRETRMAEGRWGEIRATRLKDGYIAAAVINVAAGRHEPSVLRRLLAHELGHAFGLGDCPACPGAATVMGVLGVRHLGIVGLGRLFAGFQDKGDSAPTRSDIARVAEGYSRHREAGPGASGAGPGAPLGDHEDHRPRSARWRHEQTTDVTRKGPRDGLAGALRRRPDRAPGALKGPGSKRRRPRRGFWP
jgi:hypothetical protein